MVCKNQHSIEIVWFEEQNGAIQKTTIAMQLP